MAEDLLSVFPRLVGQPFKVLDELASGLGRLSKAAPPALSQLIADVGEGTPGFTAASRGDGLASPLTAEAPAGAIPNDFEAFGMLVEENPGILAIGAVSDRARLANQYGIGFFDSFKADERYNPFQGDYLRGFEGYEERFVHTRNELEGRLLKERINEERDRGVQFERYNPTFLQQLGAGILTPEALIPLSRVAGLTGLKAIFKPAAEAAGIAAGVEVFRSQVDPAQQLWQSIYNVGAVGLFTGAFAGGGLAMRHVFSRAQRQARVYEEGHRAADEGTSVLGTTVSRETDIRRTPGGDFADHVRARDEAVAALEAGEVPMPGGYRIFNSGLEGLRWSQMPWYRLVNNLLPGRSGERLARIGHEMADTPGLATRGSAAGDVTLPVSVETAWKVRFRGMTGAVKRSVDDAYWRLYRGKNPTGDVATRLLDTRDALGRAGRALTRRPAQSVSRKEFGVWLSLYRAKGEAPQDMPADLLPAIREAALHEDAFYRNFGEQAAEVGLFGTRGQMRRRGVLERRAARQQAQAETWLARLEQAEADPFSSVRRITRLTEIVQDILAKRDQSLAELTVLESVPTPKGTRAYLPILYDRDAIRRNRAEFVRRLTIHFLNNPLGVPERAGSRAQAVSERIAPDDQQPVVRPRDPRTEAEELADLLEQQAELFDLPDDVLRQQAVGNDKAIKVWAAKQRVLGINPDDFREFLVLDSDHLRDLYAMRMAPAIEMSRRFGDVNAGDAFLELDELSNEALYELIMREAGDEDLLALATEKAASRQALIDLRDSVLGTYFMRFDPGSMSGRSLDALAAAAVVAQMGRSWQVAMIDAGKLVFTHGFAKTVGSLWKGFVDRAEQEVRKMNRADMELSGQSLETATLQTRMEGAHGYGGLIGYFGKAEQRLSRARSWMHFLNGMTVTTDILKRWTGIMAQTRLLQAADALVNGAISGEQKAYLRQLHIDDAMARRIYDQAGVHGAVRGETRVANLTEWTDTEAARIYGAALSDAVDRTIITPGSSDRPLFMSSPLWRTILLYKGFSFSSTQRLLAAGIQQRDLKVLQGIGAMMAMGYLVDMMRAPAYDDRSVLSPERLERAFTLSGLGGIFSDVNETLEMVSGNELGLGPLIGLDPMFKDPNWAQRWGSLAGAAIQPWMMVAWAFSDPEAQANDKAKAVRRVVPFNNLWFWNDWFGRMQQDLAAGIEWAEEP